MSHRKQVFVKARPKACNGQIARFRRFPRYCLLLLILSCAIIGSASLHAGERESQPKALLDQIWPYLPSTKRVLSDHDQQYAEAALTQWLEAYLHRDYDVVDRHFSWTKPNASEWGPLRLAYVNRIKNEWSGALVEQPWREPGYDLITVWEVRVGGESHYFALAMTNKPVPGTNGRRLIGHYELKKVGK